MSESRRLPKLMETDDGIETANQFFVEFSKQQDIKRYSRFTSIESVHARRLKRAIKDDKVVFEKSNANRNDFLSEFFKKTLTKENILLLEWR